MNLSIKKQRAAFTAGVAVYLLIITGLFMLRVYESFDGLTLKVQSLDKKMGVYKDVQLAGSNHFVSGTQGDLYWKPRTLTQSVLLITVNDEGFDFLDIVGLLVIAIVIFRMFKDSKDTAMFTKSVSSGFMLLIFTMGVMGILLDITKVELAKHYIAAITGGQFSGNYHYKVITFYYMVCPLLLFLLRLPQKGLELQKEAALTI